jgi:hypothetical protein
MTVPGYLPFYVILGSAAVIAGILFGLNRPLGLSTQAMRPTGR